MTVAISNIPTIYDTYPDGRIGPVASTFAFLRAALVHVSKKWLADSRMKLKKHLLYSVNGKTFPPNKTLRINFLPVFLVMEVFQPETDAMTKTIAGIAQVEGIVVKNVQVQKRKPH